MATTTKKASRSKLWLLFLFLSIGGLIFYVSTLEENFKQSQPGKFLDEIGVLHYAELTRQQVKIYSRNGYEWANKNAPHYYALTLHYTKPYVELFRDLGYMAANFLIHIYSAIQQWVHTSAPAVETWVNENLPHAVEFTKDFTDSSWKTIKHYSFRTFEAVSVGANAGMKWAEENVFVGKLSPENLKSYTLEAVNTTQTYATKAYNWVMQQVSSFNKVH